jgi:hypothetical protein
LGQVRVEGYKAIVAVSKEDKGILKRNVDVLVQLLQCGEHNPSLRTIVRHSRIEETDDPEEIIHIRQGLEQHLAIEPSVTMTVLCDQLSWTEDEQGNREQLRTLVLEFLARSIGPLNIAITRSSDRILVEGIISVSFLPFASIVRLHASGSNRPFQCPTFGCAHHGQGYFASTADLQESDGPG